MKLSYCLPALAIVFVAVAPSAFAFSTVTSDNYPANTLSTRLADPDDIMQDMGQRYGGGGVTIQHFGNTTVGIVGPSGGYGAGQDSFVGDPGMGTVPSKREGW
jgi:hypothetical protein